MLYIVGPHIPKALIRGADTGQLYKDVEWNIKVFQTAAVLEVIHALLGLVKTNPSAALIQLTSRVAFVWALFDPVPESTLSRAFPFIITAWIITDVVRYAFYTTNLMGADLYLIKWLR